MTLPDREAILAFIRQSPSSVGKREIARAFHLKGAEREALKQLLAEMEEDGLLDSGPGRSLHMGGGLPRVAVLIVESAEGARIRARPERWGHDGEPPEVLVAPGNSPGRRHERLQAGDRILTRISGEPPRYLGSVIKRLARGHATLIGVVQKDGKGGLHLQPVDKRSRRRWPIHHGAEVEPGMLVRAELKGAGARSAAHITEHLGDPFASGLSLSDIAIAAKGIPAEFAAGVEEDARRSEGRQLGPREDWTAIPFVTIDPPDARDFDDAVYAEADGDGWRLLVAIADVSWYVRPGTALDRSAFDRGNSIYFPDKVVPMLPEALSAGACSLKAGPDKAVLAADIRLSGDGEIQAWSFHRARVRMVENLAYQQAQDIIDGKAASHLKEAVLEPLWGCWRALMTARARRDPLGLELPEKRVLLDAEGRIADIVLRERFDAHRVIEEMMIAANVAAAKALEAKKAPVMYRNHGSPDREKLTSLKEYLGTLGVSFALGQVITTSTFNRILDRTKERTDFTEISEAVLRSQMQAYYGPVNEGHFGLSLGSYAHFTSPIRRYADVLVHRSLVESYHLGEGGLPDGAWQRFAAIGEHISFTERRAMEAERETLDRYVARYMAAHVGQIVRARVSGVRAFGFFATVEAIGGDGLVPVSALGDERFRFDEAGRFLEGAESGRRYAQGQWLDLKLEEADPVSGSLRFSVPGIEPAAQGPHFRRDARRQRGGPPPGVKRSRRG